MKDSAYKKQVESSRKNWFDLSIEEVLKKFRVYSRNIRNVIFEIIQKVIVI